MYKYNMSSYFASRVAKTSPMVNQKPRKLSHDPDEDDEMSEDEDQVNTNIFILFINIECHSWTWIL